MGLEAALAAGMRLGLGLEDKQTETGVSQTLPVAPAAEARPCDCWKVVPRPDVAGVPMISHHLWGPGKPPCPPGLTDPFDGSLFVPENKEPSVGTEQGRSHFPECAAPAIGVAKGVSADGFQSERCARQPQVVGRRRCLGHGGVRVPCSHDTTAWGQGDVCFDRS